MYFRLLAWIGLAVLPAGAVTVLQTEGFGGPTSWQSGGPNPNPPVIVSDAGPSGAGDFALQITATGSGAGGRLVAFDRSVWTGDYLTAGVSGLSVDLSNSSSTDLFIRFAFNGAGGWFTTSELSLTAGSGWVTNLFDVSTGSLESAGGSDAAATMSGVTEVRIIDAATADFHGDNVSAVLFVDNIQAVPEPAVGMLAMAGLALAGRRRRIQR